MSFFVGLSHPWVSCGHDFGLRPPAWQGSGRSDWSPVEADLVRWRDAAEIGWSRWWLLAGGVNYPVGRDPDEVFERRGNVFVGAPPKLSVGFLDDFEALLRVGVRTGVKIVPSLVSFELFFPIEPQARGTAFSGGRAPIVFGPEDSPLELSIENFLDATLSPLLEVSQRFPDAIGAWEVANEPDWVVHGGPIHARIHRGRFRVMPKTVAAPAMSLFLERAVDRIVEAGFVSTVGFKQADPKWIGTRLRNKLVRYADRGDYLHQLHYYPSLHEPRRLPLHDRLPIRPCIVGEMPTAHGRWLDPFFMRWLDDWDLRRAADPSRYLERRLDIVRRKGYPGALLWSGRSGDGATAWGPQQWAQTRRAIS